MDDYTLDINLENKTAIMILPFVTMTFKNKDDFNRFMNNFGDNSDGFILVANGNKVEIKVKYDFGIHFSDEVWRINSSLKDSFSSLWGNNNGDNYLSQQIKLALGEYIKDNYFQFVVDILQKSADEFVAQHSSQ